MLCQTSFAPGLGSTDFFPIISALGWGKPPRADHEKPRLKGGKDTKGEFSRAWRRGGLGDIHSAALGWSRRQEEEVKNPYKSLHDPAEDTGVESARTCLGHRWVRVRQDWESPRFTRTQNP